eukprot:4210464-Amphidinium_carterae.3
MFDSEATSEQVVCAVSSMRPHELDLHCVLDYSPLADVGDIDVWNQYSFNNEDVRAAKIKGLTLLRDFDVYDVVPESQAEGRKHITTKWEIAAKGGEIKCRMVARKFKWLEERDDVFAPASLALTSKVIDFLSCKDDDENDPMVTFIANCVSAVLQAPQVDEWHRMLCNAPG